jgi:hypothetical protein
VIAGYIDIGNFGPAILGSLNKKKYHGQTTQIIFAAVSNAKKVL